MTPSPVLILTAGFGEGHNAAARALAAACDDMEGPGTARLIDLLALTSPRMNEFSRRSYLAVINRFPRLWRRAYLWMDRSPLIPRLIDAMRPERSRLAAILAAEKPAVVCSTYPVYAFLLERLRRDGAPAVPQFNVVTDSISINSLWWRGGCDGWFLPNEDSAAVLRQAGVDEARLHVTGFPVPSFFSRNAATLSPPDLEQGAAPRVLYIVNSGTRSAAATAALLLAEEGWEVTCAVGRDDRLRRELERRAAGRRIPATILGWTNEVPRLMMTHHVLVSKAGGATTQEAVAARCPMIVNQIVPGQEEGNYELLRRHGAGTLAETPEGVAEALRAAFAARGRLWRSWRTALDPLHRPDAARTIAHRLFEAAGRAPASATR